MPKAKNILASLCFLTLSGFVGTSVATSSASANTFGDYLNSRHAGSLYDYAQAAELLNRVLKARPDDYRIKYETLQAYIYAGRYDDMIKLAANTAANDDKSLPLVNFINGLDAIVKGDFDKAATILSAMERTRLEKFTVPLALAWAEVGRGNFDAASKLMEKFDTQGGFKELKALHSGLILARAGKPDAAEAAFLNGKGSAINLPLRTFRAFIRLKIDSGKQEEARNLLTDYMAAYSDHTLLEADMATLMQDSNLPPLFTSPAEGIGDGIFHIASALYQQSQDIGFQYARLANWVAPNLPATTIFIAGAMEDRSRFKDANEIYDLLPSNSPYLWNVRLQRAENLYELGDTEQAIENLQEMVSENPGKFDALASLGGIYRRQERFEEAADAFDKAISRLNPVKPEHFFLYYYSGMTHERAKQWDKAEPRFLKALELQPGNPNILNYLGYSWVELGINIEKAQEMIRQAVAQQRHNGYIVDSLGWVYYKVGKFEDAVQELEQAVLLLPQDPTVNDHLGDAYWFVGRQREARYQWERASKMNPSEDLMQMLDDKLANGLTDSATVVQ